MLSQARQALGKATAAAAWAEGKALTLEEAYDLAVSFAAGEHTNTGV